MPEAILLLLLLVALAVLAGEPVDEGTPLLEAPVLEHFVDAPYPPEAEALGLEGDVLLALEIDASGAVVSVEVIEGAGHGFDEAAVEAARAFRFVPARDAEGPVAVQVTFRYHFTLDREAVGPVVIEGRLRRMVTREPVEEAVVEAFRDGEVVARAVSDDEGRFALRGLAPGPVRIVATRPGHQSAVADLDVVSGEVAELTLWLRRTAVVTAEEEVVVYGERRAPEVTRRSVSMDEVRRVPGTFGDPVRIVQSLPGAARSPFGTGLLILRGANPEDSNVYVDGVEVPLVYHLGGFRSILAPNMLSSVEYLPGTYGVRYGRSIGGVVDLRTRETYPEQPRVAWRTDLLDTGVSAEGRVGGWGFSAGVRRSYVDALLAVALANRDFYAAPRWVDYQLKLQPLRSGRDRLSFLVFGFQDDLVVRLTRDAEEAVGVSYSTHRLVVAWERSLGDGLRLRLQPSIGIDDVAFGFGSAFAVDLSSLLVNTRGELTWDATESLTVRAGVDNETSRIDLDLSVGRFPVDQDNPLSEDEPLVRRVGRWRGMPDPFVEATWRPLADPDRLVLVPGIRLDVMIQREEAPLAALAPRVGARWRVLDSGVLKAGSGRYHQPPQGANLGLARRTPFERAWGSEVGWEQRLAPGIRADLTGFYRHLDRLVVSSPLDEPETGRGRAYGSELMLRHEPIGRFFGWLSYTLSRSERDDGQGFYRFDFDQTHIVTAVAGQRLPGDVNLSGRVQYVTGNPYTPYRGGIFQMDTGTYLPIPGGAVNSARMPPFYALDLRADKRFAFRRWQLELFVDVLNTVRGQNPEFVLYSYDYREQTYIRGLPLIPSFGFLAEVFL